MGALNGTAELVQHEQNGTAELVQQEQNGCHAPLHPMHVPSSSLVVQVVPALTNSYVSGESS
jgi:hypothetical protein